MTEHLRISTQSTRASLETTHTWQSTSAQRYISLLLLRRRSDGQEQQWHAENGHENIIFTDEKFFTTEDQYSNQNNNIYIQTSLEVRSENIGLSSPFLRHGLVWDVPSVGDTSSFFQEKGEIGVRVYQEDVFYGVVKQFDMTLFSGQEWVFKQDSVPAQNQDESGVTVEELSGLYQHRGLALGESRLQRQRL